MLFVSSIIISCWGEIHGEDDPAAGTIMTNSVGMELVAIPEGAFLMGSTDDSQYANDDEKPQHPVKITRPFFMGVYEVTQEEYEKVMGVNPSFFSAGGRGPEKVVGIDTRRFPVEFLRAEDADAFCKKLSELPSEKAARRVYRLPSEAEWEYACRAGTSTEFHYGETLSSVEANFNGGLPSPGAEKGPYLRRPVEVGSYKPNAFGLYDMHGNVWEWCTDSYHADFYKNAPAENPIDKAPSGDRVVRGGSWGSDAMDCRSRLRYNVLPVRRYQTRGFRVVMRIATETEIAAEVEAAKKKAEEASAAAEKLDPTKAAKVAVFQKEVRPLLKKYCTECHGGAAPAGDLALDQYVRREQIATTGRAAWKRVWGQLVARAMPPEEEKQLEDSEFEFLTQWVDETLADIDCSGPADPGHEPIRRLTRSEYENTIRDLLNVAFEAAGAFPGDDTGATGDALSLPPVLMEAYLSAAEEIAPQAIELDLRAMRDDRPALIFVAWPSEEVSREKAAHAIVDRLMSRAFRRPASDLEIERLLRLVVDRAHEQGSSFEETMELALQVILASPNFLFKVETDPKPKDSETVRDVDEYELATRMSYFLWSSMPDEELTRLAQENRLRENLRLQIGRMLNDPKASALVRDFGGKVWLQLPQLEHTAPDGNLFPQFDTELRVSMRTESEMFLEAILREDRSILELVNADFTFVNLRLARHYGMPEEGISRAFQRVGLGSARRGGVITQGSVLTLTSNPDRTSPVKRGKWIMENILGTPPPSPPPGASEFAQEQKSAAPESMRERMELHRENPRCSVCHEEMDSLGFALENFDAIGRWRTHEGELPIDSSGVLPGGESFQGPSELKGVLRDRRRDGFVVCFVEKMLSYALGRELEYFDQCAVDRLTKMLAEDGYRFSALVTSIIESDPFQKRRGRRRSTP